jgi:carboxylate-amine ligase
VCDLPPLVDDVVAIAAMVQAIAAKLAWLQRRNLSFNIYRSAIIEENKWRAARYGVRGKLIDWGKKAEVPFSDLAHELVEFVWDVAGDLGSRKEIEGVLRIVREGTSAERQLAVWEQSGGDAKAVVDHLLDETMRGVV